MLTAVTAMLAMIMLAAPSAPAAAVKQCGKTGDVRNITTRGVSCSTARGFAASYIQSPGCTEDQRCQLRGYSCVNRIVRSSRLRGSIDARCTRGSRVVRFQHDYV